MAASSTVSNARPQHRAARVADNGFQGCLALDWNNGQEAASGASSTASAAFDTANDRAVLICGDANFWYAVGPVATVTASAGAGSALAGNGVPQWVYVPAGQAIAVIQDSSSGKVSMLPALIVSQ